MRLDTERTSSEREMVDRRPVLRQLNAVDRMAAEAGPLGQPLLS